MLACGLCVMCGCSFVDSAFPPTAASIGPWDNKSPDVVNSTVKWKRVQDIIASGAKVGTKQVGARLFSGKPQGANDEATCFWKRKVASFTIRFCPGSRLV